jgi:hypothetical protein
MSYSPGDWVELTRTVDGVPAGQRGMVTSTGFLGGLDIELSAGGRLINVDASNVKAAPPSPNTGDGCGLAVLGLAAGTASVVVTLMRAWAGARWGL